MKSIHPSDSSVQRLAEVKVLVTLNKLYKLKLISAPVIVGKTLFQLDGYSKKPPVLCEIYSRIGKLKPAQKNKINKDILKMLLIEKLHGKTFRKIIAFADAEAATSFIGGAAWYAKLKDNFNIEFLVIKISSQLRELLIEAQKRQFR